MSIDSYNYSSLPEGLQGGMKRYIEDGIRAGGFLMACLENDLAGAVGKADSNNSTHIQEIVRWIYNEAPSGCWGSVGKVHAWMDSQYMATNGK